MSAAFKIDKQSSDGQSDLRLKIRHNDQTLNLCNNLLMEYKYGSKTFGFASMGYPTSQKRLSLMFYDYFLKELSDSKVLFITNDTSSEFMLPFISKCSKKTIQVLGKKINNYELNSSLTFLDQKDLLNLSSEESQFLIKNFLDIYLKDFDLIITDFPSLTFIEEENSHLKPLLELITSLFIITPRDIKDKNDIINVENYFKKFGLKLNPKTMDVFKDEKKR